MSFQNNMAKESYPYNIIQSGYAPSSPHNVFKSCTTPVLAKQLFHTLVFSNLFNFHAIHEREPWTQHYRWNRIWWLWRRQKGGDSLTSTRCINGLWRCPSIDINVSEQGLPRNGCTRAYKCMKAQKENQWACTQLSCSRRPRAILRKLIIGIYKPSYIMKIPTSI